MTTEDNSRHDELVRQMAGFMEDDKPKVGIFWYNPKDNILFGVMKDDAEKYDTGKGWGTLPKLHKTFWQKQHHRAVAKGNTSSIYYGERNYTLMPKGRVFIEDGRFHVAVGDWLDKVDNEALRELIEDEFNLTDFDFYKDIHWNLGHGWSEELGINTAPGKAGGPKL